MLVRQVPFQLETKLYRRRSHSIEVMINDPKTKSFAGASVMLQYFGERDSVGVGLKVCHL